MSYGSILIGIFIKHFAADDVTYGLKHFIGKQLNSPLRTLRQWSVNRFRSTRLIMVDFTIRVSVDVIPEDDILLANFPP